MFSFILAIIILIAGIVAGCILLSLKTEDGASLSAFSPIGFVGGIFLAAIFFVTSIVCSVPTGYTGIVTTFGKVEDQTLDAGIHIIAPWQEVVDMDNRVQKETVSMEGFSSDIQEVKIIYTVNYQIRKVDAMTIYRTIGKNYCELVVRPSISEAVKIAVAKFTAENLIANRSDLAKNIEEILSGGLDGYNIIVVSTAIENMDFSDAFTNAVEAKQVAAQNKLQAQIEQEQKTMEAQQAAERAKIEASAEAEVVKIKAQADMEVAKIGADSAEYQGKKDGAVILQLLCAINGYHIAEDGITILDADGNKVNVAQMNEASKNLLQYYYIMNWDGKLPDTYLGDNDCSSIILK